MRTASDLPDEPPAHPSLPPGPTGLRALGTLVDVVRNPLQLVRDGMRDYGDICWFRFGPLKMALCNDAEAARHVLVQNHRNYVKSPSYQGLKLVLGNGLVTSEGDFWRRQRRLAQPAFHRARLEGFARSMAQCSEDMAQKWGQRPKGDAFDVHREMMHLTLRIVGHTLFSTELGDESGALGPAMGVALRRANSVAETLVPLPSWLPTPENLRFRRAMRTLDGLVLRLIADRRTQAEPGDDLLGMLIGATDDTGTQRMTDAQLRDEVITLVLAGHETVAVALSWTWFLLARHREARQRLRDEVKAVVGDRPVTFDDLPKLQYTGWVASESMRLYPPVWMIERQAIGPDTLMGYPIPPKTLVGISPWNLHHHPRYWRDPDAFDPERFSEARCADRPKYAYLPFGAGPRQCIGNHFALTEIKIVLATLAARFDLNVADDHVPELDPGITLRPAGGMPVTLG